MASRTGTIVLLLAVACVSMMLQGCGGKEKKKDYSVKAKKVYSNSKYLADLQHGMSVSKCKKLCNSWKDECKDLCKEDKKCSLSDEVDARHFTREESCKRTCVGFNMHGNDHCTLFADNVKLRHGGRGTFYIKPGSDIAFKAPKKEPTEAPTHKKPKPTPRPTSRGYREGKSHVYSNNKYLADFDHGMELDTCKHRCNNWQDVCPHLCEEEHACLLSDDVDARHYTRKVSCKKECEGFNWHPDTGHCTLFAENMELLHGGRGVYYGRPGSKKPEFGSLGLYMKGHGLTVESLLTPMSFVIAGVVALSLVFLVRWKLRCPEEPNLLLQSRSNSREVVVSRDCEVPLAAEE